MSNVAVTFDEKKIDAIFAEFDQCQLPGAAVGIAIGGAPAYRKGFGLASMELPLALSPSIRMRIYSTTKHFACLAYMLLCEEGQAAPDDFIGKHLPELHPIAHGVTVLQLMGNTSGLRDVHDICYQFSGTGLPVSSAALLELYRTIDDVHFPPGTAWSYNNGGFLLLSFIIERITGQRLEDVLRQRIFIPVGMHDTLLRRFDTDFVANSATMHMTSDTGGYIKSYLGTASAGEGGIVSTVNDMLIWLAHMDAPRVGSAATWELMKTPQILANGVSTNYGLGLFNDHFHGVQTIHHGGTGMGAHSQMLKVPAAGLDLIIMVNRQDASVTELTEKILQSCIPELRAEKSVPQRAFAQGVFLSPTSGRVIELRAATSSVPPWTKEGQQVAFIDGFDVPVEADERGVLWPVGVSGTVKQSLSLVGSRESPTSISFSDFGNVDDLTRVPRANQAVPQAILGRYRSSSTDTEALISVCDSLPRLRTVGRFGSKEFQMECLAEGIWRSKARGPIPWGGILVFDADGNGFRFTSFQRTRVLPFRRCA